MLTAKQFLDRKFISDFDVYDSNEEVYPLDDLLQEFYEEKITTVNRDYAKCAEDILKLDMVDAVINKQGCLVDILKRHFG